MLGVGLGLTTPRRAGAAGGAPGFAPSDIAGLQVWLKADSLALTDGTPVTTWGDSSSAANHAAQSTAAQKPTKQTVGGKACVRFDGVDDYLAITDVPALRMTAAATMFVVWKPTGTLKNTILTKGLTSGTPDYAWQTDAFGLGTGKMSLFDGTSWRESGTGATTAGVVQVQHLAWNGTTVNFGMNGAATGDVATAVAWKTSTDRLNIGVQATDNWSNSDMYEIIIYNTVLSGAQRDQVVTYLGAKYGLTVATGPAAIANLKLWLRADSLAIADGSPVATWADSSSAANTLTQVTGAKQPTKQTASGRAVVRFDGVDDYINRATPVLAGNDGAIYVVAIPSTVTGPRTMISTCDIGTGTNWVQFTLGDTPPSQLVIYQYASVTPDGVGAASPAIVAGTPYIFAARTNGTTWRLSVSSPADATLNVMSGTNSGKWWNDVPGLDNFNLGAIVSTSPGQYFGGDIACVLAYDTNPSDADHERILNYLSDQYAIPLLAPTSVPGLGIWLKADALGLADGTPVASFTDSSGLGNHFTQVTAAMRPTFRANVVNGKPALRLDGVDDWLSGGNPMSGAPAGTGFMVIKLDADPPASGNSGNWVFGNSSTGSHFPYYADGIIYDEFGSSARKTTVNPGPSLAAWRVYHVLSAAANWRSYLDGALLFSTATNTVAWDPAATIGRDDGAGSTQYILGHIAEIILYKAALTAAQQNLVLSYLAAKYGLTVGVVP